MEELTDDPEDITGTRIPVDKTDDLIQGPSTSQIDETSNESATSSGKISNPSEPLRCETCCEMAVLKVYKQKQLPNGGKIEDIFKNYCNKCEFHFGMCSKKVRGVYSYVTEEGRILTNAEKLEYFRAEKRKRSSSRPIEEKSPPPELKASSSEISTSSNGSGSSEEKDEGIEDIGDEAEEAPESPESSGAPEPSGVQEDVVAEPQPKVRPPRKKAKKPLFGGKRPKTNWSSSKKKKTPSDSVAPVRRVTPPKKAEPKVKKEDVKKGRGRPPPKSQNSQKDIPSTSSASSSSSSVFMQRPLLKPISTESSSCQTDLDMLLKSTYLQDAYNETMREGLGEQILARLKDQPLILRKQYLLMLKTIQAQAKDIAQYRELEQKYKKAVEHLQAFGRATRMNFSDELRSLRADMVERKKEFQDHETEMVSMFLREKKKYDAYKEQMSQKYEDQQLEYSLLEAKYQHLEQENVYEKERAEYFLQQMDRAKSKIYSAEERANTSERKLKDRLFLANNERCTGCDARESIRTKLMGEYADMKVEVENAKAEREEALKKAALFETAAINLGKDCDAMKYESNTWKAYAERYKKDVQKLQQIIKEKEKELADKAAETPRSIATPKSVALTPIYPERITPPEDGELPATPPQGSATPTVSSKPVEKPVEKPLAQKVIEKKAPPPIASGFESWIPKEKLNAPPPEIPKAVSAFGVPIKTPQQKEAERPKLAPSTQPLPWETMAKTVKTSDSLAEALSRAQADAFSGNGSTPVHASKSYMEEMNRMVNVRKRVGEEVEKKSTKPSSSPAPAPKKPKLAGSSTPLPLPSHLPVVPPAAATPKYNSPGGSSTPSQKSQGGVGSLSNLRKIPKLSEKPPQPEFAPALGLSDKSKSEDSIPGLGMDKLDEKTKEKEREELMKIKPAVIPAQKSLEKPVAQDKKQEKNPPPPTPKTTKSLPNQQQQTPPKKKNRKRPDWHKKNADNSPPLNPWRQQPSSSQQYGIQTNQQRGFPMDMSLDRPWSDTGPPQRNAGRPPNESFTSPLPWHRDNRAPPVPMQDTPFGKVPIQDFAQRQMLYRPPQQQQHPPSFYPPPPQHRDNNFYSSRDFSPPNHHQHHPQPRMFSPPPFGYSSQPPNNNGNPRSFYS